MNAQLTSRRGAVYLLVIMTTTLVVAMALGGALVERAQRRGHELNGQAARARSLAQSAVDLGMQTVFADAAWRTNQPANGQWLSAQKLSTSTAGTVSLLAYDPVDADLRDDPDDGLVLRGIGEVGEARQMIEVLLQAQYAPMPCITGALHCAGGLSFAAGSSTISRGTFSTNLAANAVLATIAAPVEAGTTVVGLTYTSGTTGLAGTRSVPDQTVTTTYEAEATPISYASLSWGNLRRVVLSPKSNPFGTSNRNGVYLIDCGGADLTITNCRIVGTMIIKNAGSSSSITGSVNWEPAMPGYPMLLWTRGNLRINTSASALSEASLATNFNPPGTPYRGTSDGDTVDTYPSRMRGLVYTSDNLTLAGTVNLQGVLVAAGSAAVSGSASVTVTSDTVLNNNPPVGFRIGPTMVVAPGSWRRVVE